MLLLQKRVYNILIREGANKSHQENNLPHGFFPSRSQEGCCSSSHLIPVQAEKKQEGREQCKMFPGNSTAVSFPAHWPEWDLGNTHVWKVAKKMGVEVAIQRSQSHCPARGLLLKRKYSSPYCLSHFRLRFLLLRAEKKILIVKRSKIFIPAYKILGESAPPSAFPIFSPFHSC